MTKQIETLSQQEASLTEAPSAEEHTRREVTNHPVESAIRTGQVLKDTDAGFKKLQKDAAELDGKFSE